MTGPDPSVELILDLRRASYAFSGLPQFQSLWAQVETALDGEVLAPDTELTLRLPEVGELGVRILRVPTGLARVSRDTPFAVHALLEPPPLKQTCRFCQREQRRTHAPLWCAGCERRGQLCEEHAVFLVGSGLPFCPEHVPTCECGLPATTFCLGPLCRRDGRAHCAAHLVAHPNVPDVAFCARCFAELYPRCEASGCDGIGGIECLHVDLDSEQPCRRRLCARHAHRWQVYGPHRLGLGRCESHSQLRRLEDMAVMFQLAAGTVLLRDKLGGDRRSHVRFPTLPSIRHILMKARNRLYEVTDIKRMCESLVSALDTRSRLQGRMREMLDRDRERWAGAIARHEEQKELGRQIFANVQALLRQARLDNVADELVFTDYRPMQAPPPGAPRDAARPPFAGLLFVRCPEDLRGLLVGRGGQTIKELQRLAGVKITFEREQ